MSYPMAVVRVGRTGPLHIAWVEAYGYDTLCDRTLEADRVGAVWRKPKAARAWRELRHCSRCELRDAELRG